MAKPTSTKEYFEALPADRRKVLGQMRNAIKAAAPRAEESFGYGVPAFTLHGQPLFWYASWKQHYSLYPLTLPVRRAHAEELKGYVAHKGTIQFPADEPLPVGLVKKLVRSRAAELRAEKD